MAAIREPAVAGMFYPVERQELKLNVDDLLKATKFDVANAPAKPPKAIIAPHAGYIYSGPTAAEAYQLLKPYAQTYQRVVLLGPSHRVGFSGIATCSADYYQSPLGSIPLDKELTAKALRCTGVVCLDQAHLQEHSLEVHLPFLQAVLESFLLTPLVVGDCEPSICGGVINTLWGDPGTLFVISSDLSHFLDYQTASRLDLATCAAIEAFDGDAIHYEQACGRNPIKGLLTAANSHPLEIATLDLCNSGDTAGDKQKVVGYGAWAFWEK